MNELQGLIDGSKLLDPIVKELSKPEYPMPIYQIVAHARNYIDQQIRDYFKPNAD
jgi:hypothetical protein